MSNKFFHILFLPVCILLTAIVIFSSPVISADYPSNGVNLEYCRTSEDCAGSRPCYYVPPGSSSLERCTLTAQGCFCRYGTRTTCSTSADCPIGERCFFFEPSDPEFAGKFCWTCRMQLTEADDYVDADPPTCKDVWLGGYTGDICHLHYYDCAADRRCVQFLEDGTFDICPLRTEPCFCWPRTLTACSSSVDCEDQERCATSKEGVTACYSCGRVEADDTFTKVDLDAICSSPSPINSPDSQISPSSSPQDTHSPSPQDSQSPSSQATQSPSLQAVQTSSGESPTPSTESSSSTPGQGSESSTFTPAPFPGSSPSPSPCIAVVHLSEFQKEELVFDRHIRAGVLCDEHQSCATPGHMVVFHNRGMTMASYCAGYATCSRRTTWVNNPRMRQALRVVSYTEGLQFTALSARYGTKIEEYFLKLVIFSGI